jgi:hypothetical protein
MSLSFENAEIVSAVSMTPLKSFQRCQWHRWNSNIIDFLGEYEAICETALGHESGPYRGDCLMKKPRVENLMQLSLLQLLPFRFSTTCTEHFEKTLILEIFKYSEYCIVGWEPRSHKIREIQYTWGWLMKKTESRKSRATVPLMCSFGAVFLNFIIAEHYNICWIWRRSKILGTTVLQYIPCYK